MQKGFSLFTPLIGTTVIIIAIMVSAVMVQNDVNVSRAIAFSYQQNAQEVDAQLIRAGASISIFNSIREFNENYLDGKSWEGSPRTISITCSRLTSVDSCKNKLVNDYKEQLQNYLLNRVAGSIISSVSKFSGYDAVPRECPIDDKEEQASVCISNALHEADDLYELKEVGSNFKISFKISASNTLKLREIEDSLVVKFKNDKNEYMALSVLPYDFSYITTGDLAGKFEKMAEIHNALVKAKNGQGICKDKTYEECLKDKLGIPTGVNVTVYSSGSQVKTVFEWDSGLNVEIKSSNSNLIYVPHCIYKNGGVSSSLVMGAYCTDSIS